VGDPWFACSWLEGEIQSSKETWKAWRKIPRAVCEVFVFHEAVAHIDAKVRRDIEAQSTTHFPERSPVGNGATKASTHVDCQTMKP
jgi:hypothetical protein